MTQKDTTVSTERLRKDRGPEWCAIFDTLREFTLSNMVFDGTEDAFCLVDAVSNAGGDISTGEDQILILADEISLALSRRSAEPAPIEPVAVKALTDLTYLLECVDTHAEKFPVPTHMRAMVQRIRSSLVGGNGHE